MTIEFIAWVGLSLIGLIIACWFIYHVGHSAGYRDGWEAALDKMANKTAWKRQMGLYDE